MPTKCQCFITLQIRDFLQEQMSLRGIEFHTEESPQAIQKTADGLLSLKTSKGTVEGFSHVMFATGRRPNTKVRIFCSLTFFWPPYCKLKIILIWKIGKVNMIVLLIRGFT